MKKRLCLVVVLALLPFVLGQGCPSVTPAVPETKAERAHRICTQEFFITEENYRALVDAAQLDYVRGITRQADEASVLSGCDECGENWCHSACSDCGLAIIDMVYSPE